MRRLAVVAIAALALACAKTEDEAEVAADTTRLAPAPATPGPDVASMAGTWRVNVMPVDKDSVLTSHDLWLSADTSQWKMKFDDRSDTIKVNVVALQSDSVTVQFGPYNSALRKNVQVVTDAVYRLQGDKLVGNILAHYSVSTPDSLVRLRFEGTRVQ